MTYLVRLVVALGSLAIGSSAAWAAGATQVSGGADHTCALTTGGGVVCWGANFYGQLGDGTTTDSLTPIAVSGLESGVAAISAGAYHTCALTAGGGVLCWGYNEDGELGDGTTADSLTPVAVSGLASGVKAIAGGGYHTCALTTGGAVLCWGANWMGQLGDDTLDDRLTPTAVSGLETGVAAVAAGGYYTCALTTAGAALCWGNNFYGQIGDGTTENRRTPVAVTDLGAGVAGIATGWDHSCAVTAGGAAVCWGSNWFGTLGDGTTEDRVTPVTVSGLGTGVAAVTAGTYHTCAQMAAGDVLCWGAIGYAGFGGPPPYNLTPTAVSGLTSGATSVAAGGSHTCAVTERGAVACWGYNGWGQLGDGTTDDRLVPTPVAGLEGRRTVAGDFTGDLKSDILWQHTSTGAMYLWPMDGVAPGPEAFVGTVADAAWQIRSTADFTGDGQADLLWRHAGTGAMYLWPFASGAAQPEEYVGSVPAAYDIVASADFSGDGKADLLWRNVATGDLYLWRMNGSAFLGEDYAGKVGPVYAMRGTGDLDGNGCADLVWQHTVSGDVYVWLMQGATLQSEVWVATVSDLDFKVAAVGDFTGDGKADLLWHHATQGSVYLWTMNGGIRDAETWVTTVWDTNYQVAASGDYDGDGKTDLVWRHVVSGAAYVWLMDGAVRVSETYIGTVPVEYKLVYVK